MAVAPQPRLASAQFADARQARSCRGMARMSRNRCSTSASGVKRVSMQFEIGDRVFCGACAHCRRNVPLFRDETDGRGPVAAPVTGAFAFACPHCGKANAVDADAMTRCRVGKGATPETRIFVPEKS